MEWYHWIAFAAVVLVMFSVWLIKKDEAYERRYLSDLDEAFRQEAVARVNRKTRSTACVIELSDYRG